MTIESAIDSMYETLSWCDLPVFITLAIFLITSNPLEVKCTLDSIITRTLLQRGLCHNRRNIMDCQLG